MLTENFTFKEFTDKGFPLYPTSQERFLLLILVNHLQKVREYFGFPIIITDCYRTVGKYEIMKSKGLHPSSTSDHFWGQTVSVDKHTPVYGKRYALSCGAVDITVNKNIQHKHNTCEALYFTAKRLNLLNDSEMFGQICWETREDGIEWIHLSNNFKNIFSKDFIEWTPLYAWKHYRKENQYLISKDGGKTYTKDA